MSESDVGNGPNPLYGGCFEGETQELADLRRSQAAQIAALKTVMIAAAEEIHEHWEAHCDAEGYGPANLMRRLEDGIAAEYGYTAGNWARLTAERDTLRADLARLTAERDSLREFANSEGSRAVTYLRRARKAEKDAARYRHLRSVDSFAEWNRLGHYAADALDATVDAALAAREQRGTPT